MNEFGEYIRKSREARKLTPTELAAALGRDNSYVSRLETGRNKRLPDPDEFNALAKVLGVPMTDLLAAAGFAVHGGTEQPSRLLRKAKARQIAADLADFTDLQLDLVEGYVSLTKRINQ